MATPQEVLANIVARLQQQMPAYGDDAATQIWNKSKFPTAVDYRGGTWYDAQGNPVGTSQYEDGPIQPLTGAPGVTPTTTTGLGGVTSAVPDPATGMINAAGMQDLLKATMEAYRQGGTNVGNIYGATNQNFTGPGNAFLLQLITSLMGQGLTEDQIMADPSVTSYLQNFTSLLGNSAQNQATDMSWFEKMGNLSAAALAQGQLMGGGGGGSGGGGGGGRGGGGRGGGGYGGGGYRRYGGGGYGGGGYGSDDLSTKTTGYFQETAKEVMNEYAPDFNKDTLARAGEAGLDADQMELLGRILDASGNNPRQLNKDAVEALDALDLSLEEDQQPLNVIAQRRSSQMQNASTRADDVKAAIAAAFSPENWQNNVMNPDKQGGGPGVLDMLLGKPQRDFLGGLSAGGAANLIPGMGNVTRGVGAVMGGDDVHGGISPELQARMATEREQRGGELPPEVMERLRQKALKAYMLKHRQRMNPYTYTKTLDMLPKTEYNERGQIVKPQYDEAGNRMEYDLNGNELPTGRSSPQIRSEIKQALSERAVWDYARMLAHEFDPNISPNVTQRQVVAQGQNKTQQTAYPNDGDYGYGDVLVPNQPEELTDNVLTGMAGEGRGIARNPAIQKLLAQRIANMRRPSIDDGLNDKDDYKYRAPGNFEDDQLLKTKPYKDPPVRLSDLIQGQIPGKMAKPGGSYDRDVEYGDYKPTGYSGGMGKLIYERGGYKIAKPAAPRQVAPKQAAPKAKPTAIPVSTGKKQGVGAPKVKTPAKVKAATPKSKTSNVKISQAAYTAYNNYRKTLKQKEKGKGF